MPLHEYHPRTAQCLVIQRLAAGDDDLLHVVAATSAERLEEEARLHRCAGEGGQGRRQSCGGEEGSPSVARVSAALLRGRPAVPARAATRLTSPALVAGARVRGRKRTRLNSS